MLILVHRADPLLEAAASIMALARWAPKRVQIEFGHSDPAFTLRIYSHLFETDVDAGRRQLDALLASRTSYSQGTAIPTISRGGG
jgi:hypothetical protein